MNNCVITGYCNKIYKSSVTILSLCCKASFRYVKFIKKVEKYFFQNSQSKSQCLYCHFLKIIILCSVPHIERIIDQIAATPRDVVVKKDTIFLQQVYSNLT